MENSLLKCALGYEYEERVEQDIQISGRTLDGMRVQVPAHKTTTHKRYMAPNVAAICFYLQNRLPGRWKNTYRVESKVENTETKNTNVQHNINIDLNSLEKKDIELLRTIIRRAQAGEIGEGNRPEPVEQIASV